MGARPVFCDNVDALHVEIHGRRLKARQLAHAGKFDSAALMLDLARDLVDDGSHRCTIADSLRQDIETTDWYVNSLRRPSLLAEQVLSGGVA